MFIYDNQFNLVKSHVFDGDVCDMSYCNQTYYVKIGNLADKDSYTIYSSTDVDNWIAVDELSEVPITNNNTVLLPEYERENMPVVTYTSRDTVKDVKLKTSSAEYTFVNYETKTDNKLYVLDDIYAAKMSLPDGIYIGFSRDGVYFYKVKLPDDFIELSKRVNNNADALFYILGDNIVYEDCGFKILFNMGSIRDALGNSVATYVKANNQILGFDTAPVTESDRTLVPLRFIFETLGADVDWEAATQTAIVKDDDTAITFSINNTIATVNGANKTMDVPARLIDDKTLVPLRFLSEELGFDVEWNEDARIATIK